MFPVITLCGEKVSRNRYSKWLKTDSWTIHRQKVTCPQCSKFIPLIEIAAALT